MIPVAETTVVRPATDGDADLLVAWHADPEVSRYWDDETFTRDEVLARIDRELVDAWIVEAGASPSATCSRGGRTIAPRRGGLDGFIAPEARGRGLMPDAARALAQSLLDSGWQYVTVDPYPWNERAIRAWAKAGFVEVSRGEHVLMQLRASGHSRCTRTRTGRRRAATRGHTPSPARAWPLIGLRIVLS